MMRPRKQGNTIMKFEFTTKFKQDIYGKKAFQIRALIDFKTKEGVEIKKGDLGE